MQQLTEAELADVTQPLFVGNDSGLTHLAAAAGAPMLGLFGPTSVEEYAPAGRRTAVARGSAMAELSVDDAFATAASRIAVPEPA
jgi:ADP-heptose:LPS heptosyltransferase